MPKQWKGSSFSPKVGKQAGLNRKGSVPKQFVPRPSGPVRCTDLSSERYQRLLSGL